MTQFPPIPERMSEFRRDLILKARAAQARGKGMEWASYSQYGRTELFYGLSDCKGFATNVRIPGQDALRVVDITGPGDACGLPARVTVKGVTHYGTVSAYSASGLDSDDCVGFEFAGPTLNDDEPRKRLDATLNATYKRLGIA